MLIRSPIICLLAHVDHGKTSVLDAIRGTRVAAKEAGAITQMIGASYITKQTIDELAKPLKGKLPTDFKIPGLLFIDTPGHEAFSTLRERGGSIADLVILLVDVAQGFQPQTIESVKILKQTKTPFILAANKVDLISGWKSQNTTSILESLSKQPEHVQTRLDEKMYEIMGKTSEHGFDSERFDRIDDFTKQIAILPLSAKTKEGLSELLVIIAGLSQKFLEKNLNINEKSRAKGSVIEVKEEKGLGTTVDVIVYDGVLRKNDEIIFLTENGAKTTKVRGLLEPSISGKEKFRYLDEVVAAAGVKIFAPELGETIPGSPIMVVRDIENDKKEIEQQFKEILSEQAEVGIVLKADSLGSVEALIELLKRAEIPVKLAGVGKITKKDVITAHTVSKENKHLGVVLGFNVPVLGEAFSESEDLKIPILRSDVVYKLIENYQDWVREQKDAEKKLMEKKSWPGKIKVLQGCCFRVSKPAIFGVEVTGGRVKPKSQLMNSEGKIVGEIRTMQHEKKDVDEATPGMQLALSCEGIYFGKDVCEGDTLYIYLSSPEIEKWEKQLDVLDGGEKEIFLETKNILVKKW